MRKPPLFLIAKPSIKTFADLRGANIGALSLTEGSSKLLIKMAKAEGLAAADLKINAVGGAPARQIMLKEGKIDAGMQPLPLNLEAEALGFTNLGWAGKYEPEWQFTTVNVNGDWARKNPRVATGFVRALLRGQQFIWSNPDEAAQIAAERAQDRRGAGGAFAGGGDPPRHARSKSRLVRAWAAAHLREHAGRRRHPGRAQIRLGSQWPTPNICAPRKARSQRRASKLSRRIAAPAALVIAILSRSCSSILILGSGGNA